MKYITFTTLTLAGGASLEAGGDLGLPTFNGERLSSGVAKGSVQTLP